MKKRYISGIMLVFLLIGMSALASNIQPINADLKTLKDYNRNGSNEQPIVVEHKISSVELAELKRELGVWDGGRDYTQIIDGHGTGLRPPTDSEWAEIASEAYIVEKIQPSNQPGQPPSGVDHSTGPWFPPIGNQDGEGSCTAWAVGYYMKTFQEAKEHGWDLSGAQWIGGYHGFPTPEYQDRITSPDFLYHLTNGGIDAGSSFYGAINLVCNIGASSWEKMPYNPGDSESWPSEDAWREAPLYRGNSSGFETLLLGTDDDLESLKNWIASGHLAAIAVDANYFPSLSGIHDLWTLDNYLMPVENHAGTIVGYNDTLTYSEQGESRLGAFKIANSWGEGFTGEITPDGYYWISYEAMKLRVRWIYFYQDRIDYDPKLLASFEMDHSKRGECDIAIGIGDHSSPLDTKSFSNLIDGGNQPFCSNSVVFDITEFEVTVPAVTNQSFFMHVLDRGIPPGHSWYSDGVSFSWFRLNQTFDIPETGATLNFLSYYEIEADYDYGYVELHDLDTDEWFTLPGLSTISTLPNIYGIYNFNCPLEFEPTTYYDAGRWNAFTGVSGAMYEETMDLTPFANHTVELYFTYYTDWYTLELGWFVDDIAIPEIGFFDDVEGGAGDWTYDGWSINTALSSTTGTAISFSIECYDSYISGPLSAIAISYDVPVSTMELDYVFAYAYMHNIETANVIASRAIVGHGFTLDINVTVVNEGAFTETFNVTVYANETATTSENITLASGNSTTATLTWDTTGFAYGNYTISAVADTVPGETDTADNTLINGDVMVTILGDMMGDTPSSPPDGDVDGFDLGAFADAYGSSVGMPAWDPLADLMGDTPDSMPDGDVDGFDLGLFADNYGKSI